MSTCICTDEVQAQEVKQEFMATGAAKAQGGDRPIRAKMDEEKDIVDKLPENLENPKFGYLVQGDKKWAFLVDEDEDGEQTLYVDTNGDKDLTNDPKAKWALTTCGSLTLAQKFNSATINLAQLACTVSTPRIGIRFYRSHRRYMRLRIQATRSQWRPNGVSDLCQK